MPRTDYKFNYILRDGIYTEVKATFYEGDFVLESGKSVYKRGKKLRSEVFLYSGELSDRQIREKLNKVLAKDTTREAIDQQKDGLIAG